MMAAVICTECNVTIGSVDERLHGHLATAAVCEKCFDEIAQGEK